MTESVVHKAPSPQEVGMPCCFKTPYDLPHNHRITLDPAQVTCTGGTPMPEEESDTESARLESAKERRDAAFLERSLDMQADLNDQMRDRFTKPPIGPAPGSAPRADAAYAADMHNAVRYLTAIAEPMRVATDLVRQANSGAALAHAIYHSGAKFVLSMPEPVIRAYIAACNAYGIGKHGTERDDT